MSAHKTATTPAEVQRDWIARARSLKPILEAAAPRIEQAKSVPPEALEALHNASMFRMMLPKSVGGAELDLATFAQVVATIAEGDASVAWCVAQSAGCSMSAAYLDLEVAKEIFGPRDAVLSWGFASNQPPCRAVPVKDGWIVNGAWTFASGNRVSKWLGGHAQLCDENGTPRLRADGGPLERTMLFPRASARVREDLWDVMGLVGTGSDSYAITDLFVPTKYSLVPRCIPSDQQLPEGVKAEPDPERREQGILYRCSSQAAHQAGLTSIAIGIARAMLDSFIALARKKSPSSATHSLRDDTWVQARIAQADAKISAASAWTVKLLEEAWHEAATQGEISFPLRVKIRLACTHQINEATEAVDMIFREAGATGIFKNQPFERRFRDMHTVAQQVQGSVARMQSVGRHYLGMPPQLFLLP
jgi:alkylation response protein AidB-like acyl-CoA dehydrogenase